MKKFLTLMLVLSLCAMLFACSSAKITAKPITITEPTEETTAAPTAPVTEPVFEEEEIFEDEMDPETESALGAVINALSGNGISQTALVESLEADGYSIEAIMYAVNNASADWNAQAVKAANAALATAPNSPTGIHDQLVNDGFTAAQADYAIANCGSWNAHAVAYAKLYYATMDAADLQVQLVADGFTSAQAAYAAEHI